jgi:uncharacterized protein
VVAIIESKSQELERLCREYSVARLELFGSAADGTFDPKTSDLDFLVEFTHSSKRNAFHQYFDFLFALEELFERHVDLVHISAMKNPYFIESVNRSRTLVYAT